jgi:hypothetical protein
LSSGRLFDIGVFGDVLLLSPLYGSGNIAPPTQFPGMTTFWLLNSWIYANECHTDRRRKSQSRSSVDWQVSEVSTIFQLQNLRLNVLQTDWKVSSSVERRLRLRLTERLDGVDGRPHVHEHSVISPSDDLQSANHCQEIGNDQISDWAHDRPFEVIDGHSLSLPTPRVSFVCLVFFLLSGYCFLQGQTQFVYSMYINYSSFECDLFTKSEEHLAKPSFIWAIGWNMI